MRRMHILLVLAGLILSSMACGLVTGQPGTAPANAGQSQGQPLIPGSGIGTIDLLTNTTGVGTKPLFEWKAVSGASHYELIVYDDSGAPYWAWDGTQTKVYIGGAETPPPPDSAGPSVGAGYSWAVVALDASDKVIAASDTRSISP